MALKEINGRLTSQPYLSGFSPSTEDAKTFSEMFGTHTAVAQWAARMASYFQAERDEIAGGVAKKAEEPKKAAAAAAPAAKAAPAAAADDEDDLFGEETEEEKAALEAKKKADADKVKAKKEVIAKSSILIDVKPWEDTTDLEALALKIKAVEKDGLLWGAHKLVPIAYGVKKLQLLFVIEDEKVSSEDIEDIITGQFEDEVQSMDIVAWNKI